MKLITLIIVLLYSNAYADPETDPFGNDSKSIRQNRAQQARKYRATPIIHPSIAYISTPGDHVNKSFRIMIIGDRMLNLGYYPKRIARECQFSYLALSDIGFGAKTGRGHYYFVAPKSLCNKLDDIAGVDIASLDLIITFEKIISLPNPTGHILNLPLFRIIRFY